MYNVDDLQNRLIMTGQAHLLRFFNELGNSEKESFIKDLSNVDFEEINQLFQKATASMTTSVQELEKTMQQIPKSRCESEENCNAYNLNCYHKRGLEEISKGHVGVLLMAGGQGSRLGVDYPKGMYSIGLSSGKSLFQIQAERIRCFQRLAKKHCRNAGQITWYIMTSGPTVEATKKFLKQKNYFGLNPDDVVIFQQGLLPCFDSNGKILLEDRNRISLAPDGNGGIYRALRKCGILDDMRKRNIEYVHAHSVDNILVKVADPVFIGYCIARGADCGIKVIRKLDPNEALGVVCQVDGRYQVVEYSEITDKTANLKDCDGNPVFNAGNICNHFFTTDFLRLIADKYESDLKLHVAKKIIPYINDRGDRVKPTLPNGIKIEKFVFDTFHFSENFVLWEVSRRTDFSALKNANDVGSDCPSTARRDLYSLHKSYVEKAGGKVIVDEIEVSSLLSYAGEGLEEIVGGKTFGTPTYLSSDEEKSCNELI